MPASWTIGSDPECDLVVESPTVSRRHCRLVADADGFSLEDLGSSNGTYVNGQRIATRVRVSPGDAITLGLTVPLPWPPNSPAPVNSPGQGGASRPVLTFRGEAMVVGRDPDCHLALDIPVVSGRHARLSRSGVVVLLEDLGSSNGTYLNGRRIDRAMSVRPGDLVGLGSYTLVFAEEEHARRPQASATLGPAPPAPVPTVATSALPGVVARVWPHPWLLLALVGQVLPVSAAVGMLHDSSAGVVFWLGLAAVWFGLSSAVLTSTMSDGLGRSAGPGQLVGRFSMLAGLCVLQCVLAWVIVSTLAHLRGAAGAEVAFLALASWVGLALGVVIVLLIRARAASWLLLAPVVLMLWTLGGERWPVPAMAGWARVLSSAIPTRWAFEGLLLVEADAGGPAAKPAQAHSGVDPAEHYFPASSSRMGASADVAALVSMVIGLTALAAFIAEDSRRGT